MRRRPDFLHPIFLAGLGTLLLNDWWWKASYGNWLTGKVSDVAGLLILPLFIGRVWPAGRKWAATGSGAAFILWKTPLITPLIECINANFHLVIHRTIDYSDYWTLPVLLVSHWLLSQPAEQPITGNWRAYGRGVVGVVAAVALCATTLPRHPEPGGTIHIGETYTVKLSKAQLLTKLTEMGYTPQLDTAATTKAGVGYYRIDDIILHDNVNYPLRHVRFIISDTDKPQRCQLHLVDITFKNSICLEDWREMRRYSQQYDRLFKKYVVQQIRE